MRVAAGIWAKGGSGGCCLECCLEGCLEGFGVDEFRIEVYAYGPLYGIERNFNFPKIILILQALEYPKCQIGFHIQQTAFTIVKIDSQNKIFTE